jgi:hypothetical protein
MLTSLLRYPNDRCDKLVAMARSVVPGNYPTKPGERIGTDGAAEVNEKAR